ncbi:MAG: hypothetical protein MUF62_05690 [Chitinophagaceae bacterium]|jgi:hypothetical protein|nr:hypothetical protein [Chitinophagaceae bacterium]
MHTSFWKKAGLWLVLALPACMPLLAQNANWQRYKLGNSGCSVNLPERPADTDFSLDIDSNKVYNTKAELVLGGQRYYFSVTAMLMREELAPEDSEAAFDQLSSYMDYIKSTQNIIDETSYKKINNLARGKLAKGQTATWTDQQGQTYHVMGWINGRTVAVLYVFGEKPYPNQPQLNMSFFNSFQFPSVY